MFINLFNKFELKLRENIEISFSVSISELSSFTTEFWVITAELLGDLWFKWVVSVRILQQSHNWFYHKLGIQSWNPVIFNSLLTDLSCILFNIGVINLGLEENLLYLRMLVNTWFLLCKISNTLGHLNG